MTADAWEKPDERDILSLILQGQKGLSGSNPAARLIGEMVRAALADMAAKEEHAGEKAISPEMRALLAVATESALGAVEGKLRKASLEGTFKEAEILKLYAEMRTENAAAAKLEAEAEAVRIANARARLEAALFAVQAFAELDVAISGNGVNITVGEELPAVADLNQRPAERVVREASLDDQL
jgi:hypothetical protein